MQHRDRRPWRAALLAAWMAAVTTSCAAAPPAAPGDTATVTTVPPPAALGDTATVTTAVPEATAPATPGIPHVPSPAPAPPTLSPGAPEQETTTAASRCRSGARLVETADWVEVDGRAALEVVPTDLLRACGLTGVQERAWAEVLQLQPDADRAGLADQLTCHVLFAPAKTQWRLEPWRPVVDEAEMIRSRCNPAAT